MPAEIKTETIDLNGKSVLLVSVKNGEGLIGTCCAGHADHSGNLSNDTRLFYIGSEPIINFICPSYGNKNADKLLSDKNSRRSDYDKRYINIKQIKFL